MATTRRFDNPYVGPRPFLREDSGRFFGRDKESGELVSLIIANRSVLLYAQSGAGKTSLLNAMVIPELEEEGFEVFPQARVYGPDVDTLSHDEIDNIYVLNVLMSWGGEEAKMAEHAHSSLSDYLKTMPPKEDEYGYEMPRVLVFDQFEELFTTYPTRWQDREGFFNQVNRALEENPLLHIVFSMREDYIAQLDAYASLLPRSLRTRFRLERMRSRPALAAIQGPLVGTRRRFAPAAADQLLSELRKVRVESVSGETITTVGEFVEPVQLQVVCQNLWDDLPEEVETIDRNDLQAFGDVDQALGRFYERALGEALVAAGVNEETLREWFEEQLMTPAGTRATVYRGETKTADINNSAIQILEDFHILRGEFRAGARWYELTHDRLLEPIRRSNREWKEAQRVRQFRLLRRIGIPLFLVLVLIALFSFIFASNTNTQAEAAQQMVATQVLATQEGTVVAIQQTRVAEVATGEAQAVTATWMSGMAATSVSGTEEALRVAAATSEAAGGTATAEVSARATTDAAATVAAARVRELALERPLRTGALIGGVNTNDEAHIGVFVQNEAGQQYILTVAQAVSAFGEAVIQPSLPNNGNPEEDRIGRAVDFAEGIVKTPLLENLVLVQLDDKVPFAITIPELGPIRGVTLNNTLTIIGNNGNLQNYTLTSQESVRRQGTNQPQFFVIPDAYEAGLEGALVVDDQGFAVGMVVGEEERAAVVVVLQTVLETLDLSLVYFGRPILDEPLETQTTMNALAYSPDGRFMAAGGLSVGSDFPVLLWESLDNGLSWEPLSPLEGHVNNIEALAFSPDGRYLVSASLGNEVIVWLLSDLNENGTMQPFRRLTNHVGAVRAVAFSPDGSQMASTADDGQILLWDTNDFEASPTIVVTRGTPNRHEGSVFDIAFTPDGRFLVTGGEDGTVRLWYLGDDGAYTDVPNILSERHNGEVWSLAVTQRNDLTFVASGSRDRSIFLWDISAFLADPEGETQFKTTLSGHTLPIFDVDFNNDGTFLASGSVDNTVRLWDIGNPLLPSVLLEGHTDDVLSVAFLPSGNALGSVAQDRTIRLWETRKEFNNVQ